MKNRNMLITGCNGFIGKNLVEYIKKNEQFSILLPTRNELDLANQQSTFDYFEKHKPTFVVHLAGLVGGIYANKQRKADFFYENCMMGTLIFEASRRVDVKKLIVLGAGCGYPATFQDNIGAILQTGLEFFPSCKNLKEREDFSPYKEDEIFDGFPEFNSYGYSMAKKNLIVQSLAYKEQYDLNSSVLIPANVYGPHDYFNSQHSHVVPALIGKIIRAKQNEDNVVFVWGSKDSTREFLYVEDLCNVVVRSLGLDWTGPINVGTGTETSIEYLLKVISSEVGYNGKFEWEQDKPSGQNRRVFNLDRFGRYFENVHMTTIEEGVRKTVQWMMRNGNK